MTLPAFLRAANAPDVSLRTSMDAVMVEDRALLCPGHALCATSRHSANAIDGN